MKPPREMLVIGAPGLVMVLFAAWLIAAAGHENVEQPDQLTDLERRIDQLERIGPFEVVDSRGLPIFRIESVPDGGQLYTSKATVYSSSGEPVAVLGADNAGGFLKIRSAGGQSSSTLEFGKMWGLHFDEMVPPTGTNSDTSQVKQSVTRLELGKKLFGNFALNFFGPSQDQQIAGIGESKGGSGALAVGDSKVSNRVALSVGKNNKGIIELFNRESTAILTFGEAVNNTGGELALGAANGDPRVLMGTADNRYGVVMALPQGLPYVPRSGLPGSYLLGCAGGGSCVR